MTNTKRELLIQEMEQLLINSEMTDKDAIKLGRKVNKVISKKILHR